jgi:hypothetical protein
VAEPGLEADKLDEIAGVAADLVVAGVGKGGTPGRRRAAMLKKTKNTTLKMRTRFCIPFFFYLNISHYNQ